MKAPRSQSCSCPKGMPAAVYRSCPVLPQRTTFWLHRSYMQREGKARGPHCMVEWIPSTIPKPIAGDCYEPTLITLPNHRFGATQPYSFSSLVWDDESPKNPKPPLPGGDSWCPPPPQRSSRGSFGFKKKLMPPFQCSLIPVLSSCSGSGFWFSSFCLVHTGRRTGGKIWGWDKMGEVPQRARGATHTPLAPGKG